MKTNVKFIASQDSHVMEYEGKCYVRLCDEDGINWYLEELFGIPEFEIEGDFFHLLEETFISHYNRLKENLIVLDFINLPRSYTILNDILKMGMEEMPQDKLMEYVDRLRTKIEKNIKEY